MKSVYSLTLLVAAQFSLTASAQESLQIDGVLSARDDVIIKSTIDGIVREVHANDGDSVESGQLIVELDNDEQRAKVSVAEAAAKATADSDAAKTVLSKSQRKYKDLVIAQKKRRRNRMGSYGRKKRT